MKLASRYRTWHAVVSLFRMNSAFWWLLPSIAFLILGCARDTSLVPAHIIELNDRGVSKMGQFQYVAAHEDFTNVTQEAPHWDVGLVNLAIATLNRQEPDDELKTLEILQSVLNRSPTNVRALYTSGIVNLYLGQTDEAIEFLNRVIQIDPSDAYGTYFLGQAHLQAGNYELAQQYLLETLELNDALRSAYWAASTASRRLGDIDRATALVEEYQSFEHNPLSVTAGFSYKQMGPKAEAKSVIENVVGRTPKPDGAIFASPQRIDHALGQINSISSFDINQDGIWDILVSDAEQTVALIGSQSGFSIESTHINPHVAIAWGDVNNDGTTELVTCNEQEITINGLGEVGGQAGSSIPGTDCQTVRLLDADHDGDLDILTGGASGFRIYHNDLNGNFVPYDLEIELGLATPVTQVLAEDLDRDRDVDLILIGNDAINHVLRNELTWRYETFMGFNEFEKATIRAVTAIDIDLDGTLELVSANYEGSLDIWRRVDLDWIQNQMKSGVGEVLALDSQDFDGDGRSDLFVATSDGFTVIDPRTTAVLAEEKIENLHAAMPIYLDSGSGPAVVAASPDGIEIYPSGEGRYPFLALSLSGKTSADQMRSNASGIGTYVKLRADTRWALASSFSHYSGPSQSLMPVMFGSGGATEADYAELLWSDGVTQSEIGLKFGKLHEIEEVQRQLASCPVVFVWNGEKYEFVSDVLGVAALGYFAEPGLTTPVRSKERLLLPEGLLTPRGDNFEVKIGEPMEEILYLDSATLLYFDIPDSWSMTFDERLNVKSDTPTSDPIYFKEIHHPVHAATNIESNVMDALSKTDKVAVNPGPVDSRFIGLLANESSLTIEFDTDLPEANAVLIADGWVEFPYSQTSFAAYQANTKFQAPTIEARDHDGSWRVIVDEFGFPGGMPRQMALPLPDLPEGTSALRIRSNLEIYWDNIRVVKAETSVDASMNRISPSRAMVRSPGFALRSTGPQRTPYYDYNKRSTRGDSKFASGFYTSMGDALELVGHTDSAVAIVGSGEEIHLEFGVPHPPKRGFRRYYALEFQGWAKDMDLYTETGDTVNPLPSHDNITPDQLTNRDLLHARYNVRYQSGMAAR